MSLPGSAGRVDSSPRPSTDDRVPRYFMGRVLLVLFRTSVDLAEWVPTPLAVDDPHTGLLKVYEMKTRFADDPPQPLAISQYREACIGVMARPAKKGPDAERRGFNLINWHSSPLAVGRGNPFGHRLRQGHVEATWTFPHGDAYDRDREWHVFDVDVHRLGETFLRFRGTLGEPTPRVPEPAFNGFFTLARGAVLPGNAPAEIEVVEESLDELVESQPTYGGGTLEFRSLPDDGPSEVALLDGLGSVEVLGASLRNIRWTRLFPKEPSIARDWAR